MCAVVLLSVCSFMRPTKRSLFFILGELWGSVAISLLFW